MSPYDRVAVLIMVKNEETIIRKTLDSVSMFPFVLVFDTGSDDDTISIVESYPNTKIHGGEFADFATSRNELLTLAEKEVTRQDHLLLLDAGDEFRPRDKNKPFDFSPDYSSYLVPQVWETECLNRYYNTRLIKNNNGFRYKGKVHEYLMKPDGNPGKSGKMETFEIYQDRRGHTAASSVERWSRDLVILRQEVRNNPRSTRDLFYLAQTYECLKNKKMAYKTYKKRSKIRAHGFGEEVFISLLRCGQNARSWEKSLSWYMRAFNYIKRAEPLLKIVEHYKAKKDYHTAWMFAKMACDLEYPSQCILFVDADAYSYKRWHLLGIVSYYAGKLEDGKLGCIKAIEAKGLDVDKKNLEFYS
jgi:glycosyltransferase involved in cell wall biosynthesis